MPAGESPGTSTSRPRRVRQAGLAQPSPNQDGTSGSAQATGCGSASIELGDQVRIGDARGRAPAAGPAGLPHLLGQRGQRVLEAGLELLGRQAEVGGDRPGQRLGLGGRVGDRRSPAS